ncbi:response regulator [uncultured Sphaerotilus sp.]|uniref:response regulator transcription factor n=1 Tax=uncultured Sphaerotilus sp. TaxID=474984 RepID=UPI0030CA337D
MTNLLSLLPEPHHPAAEAPLVHVIDDYDDYRNGLLYNLRSDGFEAQGYASGEAFLATPLWPKRGVVTLDIDFDLAPPGAMSGLQIFNRLLAQRCSMPVIFLTGPYGGDVRLAVQQVTRRAEVDYFSKQAPLDELKATIRSFMAREPALRQVAEQERRLLQIVLDVLTPAEREVISRVLRGQTNYGIARELNKEEGVVELQRASAMKKLLGDSRSPQLLVELLRPLLDHHGADSLTALAEQELLYRLGLLDPLARDVLMAAVDGRSDTQIARAHGWFDETDRERRYRGVVQGHLDRALMLMQADAVRQVRKWLGYFPSCSPSLPSPPPSSP